MSLEAATRKLSPDALTAMVKSPSALAEQFQVPVVTAIEAIQREIAHRKITRKFRRR